LKKIAFSGSCEGFSGADLSALVREAQLNCIRTCGDEQEPSLSEIDFEVAMSKVFPSVSKTDEALYKSMEKNIRKSRSHLIKE